jgi:uncharacterized protein (DUF433 family)
MSSGRITVRADQMGGIPCIRELRIPVATVVGMVAEQKSDEEILAAYPDLEIEDIREAMRYAAASTLIAVPEASSSEASDPTQ